MPTTGRSTVPGGGEAESVGELSRVVFALKNDMHDLVADLKGDFVLRFDKIDARFDGLAFVDPSVYAADRVTDMERHKSLDARVGKIESGQQWLARTLGGTIIALVAGAIWALAGTSPH